MQFRISRQSNQVVVGNAAKDLVILRVGYTDRDLLFSKMARVYNENEPFVAFRADGGSRNRQGIRIRTLTLVLGSSSACSLLTEQRTSPTFLEPRATIVFGSCST